MLPEVVDRALRTFEGRVADPKMVKWVVRLLERLVDRGLDTGMVRQIQRLRLQQTIRYVYEHSPFYQEMFDSHGIRPGDIQQPADLHALPFTTADDIRDWRRFLCVPEEDLSAVFTTSGSTGEPKRVYFTWRELQTLTNLAAVGLRVGHPGRLWVLIALPIEHGLWIGTPTAIRIVERTGGLPIPVGTADPTKTLQWMRRFEPNVVMSSPSYMTTLTCEAERQGYRIQLDQILLSGEMLSSNQQRYFHQYWGASIFDAYGTTEIGGAQAIALPECTAFSLNDLCLVTEIVDPITWEAADEGELVFTTLGREGMPLIRYLSGDHARWADCPCWLPFGSIQLLRRIDDVIIAGDMYLFGRVIASQIAQIPEATGRVKLVLDKVELRDRLRVQVEGASVIPEAVRRSLYDVYPELPANIQIGNIILEIETGVDLGDQIKTLKIVDQREKSVAM